MGSPGVTIGDHAPVPVCPASCGKWQRSPTTRQCRQSDIPRVGHLILQRLAIAPVLPCRFPHRPATRRRSLSANSRIRSRRAARPPDPRPAFSSQTGVGIQRTQADHLGQYGPICRSGRKGRILAVAYRQPSTIMQMLSGADQIVTLPCMLRSDSVSQLRRERPGAAGTEGGRVAQRRATAGRW